MQNEIKTEEVFSLQLDSSQLYESMRDVNKTVGASGDCRLVIDESLGDKVLLVLGHGSKVGNLAAHSKLMLGDFNGFRHTLMGLNDGSVGLYKNVTSKF